MNPSTLSHTSQGLFCSKPTSIRWFRINERRYRREGRQCDRVWKSQQGVHECPGKRDTGEVWCAERTWRSHRVSTGPGPVLLSVSVDRQQRRRGELVGQQSPVLPTPPGSESAFWEGPWGVFAHGRLPLDSRGQQPACPPYRELWQNHLS